MKGDDSLCIGCHSVHSTRKNARKRPLYAVANRVREKVVQARALAGAVEHVSGPLDVDCGDEELVVVTLARDAEIWVKSFVEHHLEMGAKHVFYLDNGSTDGTVELASSYDRVSVFRTEIPFKHFEVGMRRWLTRRFARGRWSLQPDADELWDYPGSDRLSLDGLLRYLNAHGYRAVSCHALDMFSDVPFSRLTSRPQDDVREKYPFYDLRDVIKTRQVYWIENGQLDSPDVACTFGGVRERFFGTKCLCQTRHALIRPGAGADPYRYDGHFTAGARVADLSTVLLHYKYVSTLAEQARTNLELGQHAGGSENYVGFHEVLSRNPDFSLHTDASRKLGSVDDLVAGGLLTAPARYRRWVEEHES